MRPDHDDRAGTTGFAAAFARRPRDPSELAAYGQAVRSGAGGWVFTLLVEPEDRVDLLAIGAAVAHPVLAAIAERGGGPVRWWVRGSDEDDLLLAERLGFDLEREVVQLRVALPLDDDVADAARGLVVRPFEPDDAQDWLELNAAAFSEHPDQGRWTRDDLDARRRARWYDPAGFLVHEGDDGRIDGFCWTKVHDQPERLGEIFVIAVDPRAAGRGLGRGLVVAGLDHLASKGIETGMLWTEHDNAAARHLYEERLGFVLHHADRHHVAEVAPET